MSWKYRRRNDGIIAITLDNNVWDFLFHRKIDLAAELPSDEFAIFITREVEIERMAIPYNKSKAALRSYIDQTIAKCGIRTTSVLDSQQMAPAHNEWTDLIKEHGSRRLNVSFTMP
jgi:tRNA threonylcarbamoyladenosine modification (KEOPS) complex  Pcc1 subunit